MRPEMKSCSTTKKNLFMQRYYIRLPIFRFVTFHRARNEMKFFSGVVGVKQPIENSKQTKVI